MPNTKKSNQKTTAGKSNSGNQKNTNKNTGQGIHHAQMPHIPTARERARDMDTGRRGDAQTFEL